MLHTRNSQSDDTAARLLQICLHAAAKINRIFAQIARSVQGLVMPQLSRFQWRVYGLFVAQLFSCDLLLVCVAKVLQVRYGMTNFLLLLSLGGVLPFLQAVRDLWKTIPCPPLASVLANIALAFSLVALMMLGISTYQDPWMAYSYVMAIFPWLVLTSAMARLYIERQLRKVPFSALREIPVLGIISAFIPVLLLLPSKDMPLTDCIVLCGLDPIFSGIMASALMGKTRRKLHFESMKIYAFMATLMVVYRLGEAGDERSGLTFHHGLFAIARLLIVLRSIWVKWQYAAFHNTQVPPRPPENRLLFFKTERPQKHRFKNFSAPQLLTLDAIFDSGLRDSDLHAMGPLGTQDLYMVTESKYMLPVASTVSWLYERDTMRNGILPPSLYDSNTDSPGTAGADLTSLEILLFLFLLLLFIVARFIQPWVGAHSLFDRSCSSLTSWQYQPILLAAPFFAIDALSLNDDISKFQIVVVVALYALLAHYRSYLWTGFKRKYLLLMTQDLYYTQPAVLRQVQRRTLLEFLERSSTDDYSFLLLETAIRHGSNIRDLAKSTHVTVWDPAPTATAAWKMAFSLVIKNLRRQKMYRRKQTGQRAEIEDFLNKLVLEVVSNAVDQAVGHGRRLALVGAMSSIMGKRRALRRLREHARNRRVLRKQRKVGQLSVAPASMATAGGKLRAVKDLVEQPKARIPALPAPPASTSPVNSGGPGPPLPHSLAAAAADEDVTSPTGYSENAPLLASPQGLQQDSFSDFLNTGQYVRGIWALNADATPGSTVVALGDLKRGQLGLQPGFAARHAGQTAIPIEELRSVEPVQVEAAGVTTFVVGASGELWACGANRSMELGLRKEVMQVNVPQRVKSLRDSRIVQVSGSCVASGQAHTLALTAEGVVFSFGASSCGALGHGPDVRQTAPLLLRMSLEVPIRLVAAGACHSLFVTDHGRVYAVGSNVHGQLGIGRRDAKFKDEPVLLEGELGQQAVNLIAAGDDHCLASTSDGRLFAWGANANGQLGLRRSDDQVAPQSVRELQGSGVRSIACGSRHSLVVVRGGSQLWAFGSNVQGQLGLGMISTTRSTQQTCPAVVHALSNSSDKEVVQVAAAASHSLALTRAGQVFAFGDNTYGQLGFPTDQSPNASGDIPQVAPPHHHRPGVARGQLEAVPRVWLPARIPSLSLYRVIAITTADMHSLALCR